MKHCVIEADTYKYGEQLAMVEAYELTLRDAENELVRMFEDGEEVRVGGSYYSSLDVIAKTEDVRLRASFRQLLKRPDDGETFNEILRQGIEEMAHRLAPKYLEEKCAL